jgi:hypothetical protein
MDGPRSDPDVDAGADVRRIRGVRHVADERVRLGVRLRMLVRRLSLATRILAVPATVVGVVAVNDGGRLARKNLASHNRTLSRG